MNIILAIFSRTEGKGGHFHSLVTIGRALHRNGVNVKIVCIGKKNSAVIANSQLPFHYIQFASISKALTDVNNYLTNETYTAIHCFDELSYFFINSHTNKVLLTKCGGRNPKYYFPAAPLISLFSLENFNYFQNNKKYQNTQLSLIPNRIEHFSQDENKIQKLRKKFNIKPDDFVFLKISRLDSNYIKSIKQTIQFFLDVSVSFPKTKLLIIGAIYNAENHEEIINLSRRNENIHIVTDEEYTTNAKEVIDICDLYIGTGRSIMEAAYMSKAVACHTSNNEYPVIINATNFEAFFNINFSGRLSYSQSDKESMQTFVSVLNSANIKNELMNFTKKVCNEYFDVDQAVPYYTDLYEQANSLTSQQSIGFLDGILLRLYMSYVLKIVN
jgi:hypothetical protein